MLDPRQSLQKDFIFAVALQMLLRAEHTEGSEKWQVFRGDGVEQLLWDLGQQILWGRYAKHPPLEHRSERYSFDGVGMHMRRLAELDKLENYRLLVRPPGLLITGDRDWNAPCVYLLEAWLLPK